ncbi:hypothetical protein ACYULU_15595 [Breznakiellaceae bacterium SP9]
MKHKVFLVGMLAMVLTFGMALIGCDNGSTNDGGGGDDSTPPRLVITNISAALRAEGQHNISICILPTGTTLTQVLSQTTIVATATSDMGNGITLSGSSAPFTVSGTLYAAPDFGNPWTGSGTYDVYLVLRDTSDTNHFYKKQDVSFTSGSTSSVDATTFSVVTS